MEHELQEHHTSFAPVFQLHLFINLTEQSKKVLKKKFHPYFPFAPNLFIDFKDKKIRRITFYVSDFINSSIIYICGVEYDFSTNVCEIKKHNFVNEVPNILLSDKDKDLWILNSNINNLNDLIEIEILKVINNNEKYSDLLKIHHDFIDRKNSFLNKINTKLHSFEMDYSTLNKIFSHKTKKIEAKYINATYTGVSFFLFGKCETFKREDLCMIEDDEYQIGQFVFDFQKNIFEFSPNIRNYKIVKKSISSIRYLNNKFKNTILNVINKEF